MAFDWCWVSLTVSIEKKFRQDYPRVKLGVVYCEKGENDLAKMFKNSMRLIRFYSIDGWSLPLRLISYSRNDQ